jgi:hypothetical protein
MDQLFCSGCHTWDLLMVALHVTRPLGEMWKLAEVARLPAEAGTGQHLVPIYLPTECG